MGLYQFPKSAALGRAVGKQQIYQHTSVTAKVKERFVRDIDKIVWAYKLSSQTINIPASFEVPELQVFSLYLRASDISVGVLQAIDRAIPSPILFELHYNGNQRYVAAYKRVNEADNSKRVLSSYFETQWFNTSDDRKDLPIVLNMTALYHALLQSIIPLSAREGESIGQLIDRTEILRKKEREAENLRSKIRKEKQFNKRVNLNRTLSELKNSITELNR
ncbi:DUF4391 domain-containing protein [Gammaproteobacteria bacterium]|nr:DUF4391 domain-containing protein [Gammaproteobacteria bacterium]